MRASVLIHLPQPVDKTPFGIQTQAAFFMRIIELGTNSKKEKGEIVFGLEPGTFRLPDCQLFEIHAGEGRQNLHHYFGFAP